MDTANTVVPPSDLDVPPPAEAAKRYSVTIEREFIVYADSPEEAQSRALSYMHSVSTEQPASRPVKVVSVKEAPAADEKHSPIIDRAPAR
jgi:hypothetical protein